MFIVSALSNTGHEKSGVSQCKNCTVLLEGGKVKLSPQVCESGCFLHFFVAAMVKL